MVYSDSMHFSDKFSYKILFISSYGSKDMNLPRFAYCRNFRKQREKRTARAESGPDLRRRIAFATRERRTAAGGSGPRPNRGAGSEQEKEREKAEGFASTEIRTTDLQERMIRNQPAHLTNGSCR
jgi:hypothetical protein